MDRSLRTSRRLLGALAVAGFLLALTVGPAGAHGELEASSPEAGDVLESPPSEVSITLTEAPQEQVELTVFDGCTRVVTGRIRVDGRTVNATVQKASPGRWSMRYHAISSVDGHETDGTIAFRVSGRRDCSEEPDGRPTPTPDDVLPSEDPTLLEQEPVTDDSSSSTGIAIPLVGAGIAVIVLAFILRRSSGS